MGKKCFLCNKGYGFLQKGVSYQELDCKNDNPDPKVTWDYIPEGMGKDDRLCRDCKDQETLKKFNEIINFGLSTMTPLEFRNIVRENKVWKILYEKYLKGNPDFKANLNPKSEQLNKELELIETQIQSLDKQYASNKQKIGFNKGYNLFNSDNNVNGTLTANALQQNNVLLDTEIKKLELKKLEIINQFNNEPLQIQKETSKPIVDTSKNPLDILKLRLVKGEITKEEFENVKSMIG